MNPLQQFNFGRAITMTFPSSPFLRQITLWNSGDIDVMNATPKTVVNAPPSTMVAIPVLVDVIKPAYNPAPAGNPLLQMYYANNVGGVNLFSDTPLANINNVNAQDHSQTNRFVVTAGGIGAMPSSAGQAIVMRGNIDAPGGSAAKALKVVVFYLLIPSTVP